jgi:hypothetical protein
MPTNMHPTVSVDEVPVHSVLSGRLHKPVQALVDQKETRPSAAIALRRPETHQWFCTRTHVVVYFAKIEHLSLNNPVARHSLVLNDTPVAMFFAVLKAVFGSEKHAPIFQDKIKKSRG